MGEAVITQVITTVGVIIVAVLQVRQRTQLTSIGKDAAEARHQTQNSHGTNLRDDIDGLKDDIGVMHSDIRGIRKDVNGLRRDDGEIRRSIAQQIANLRDSLPVAIDLALVDHIRACPIRNPKEKP